MACEQAFAFHHDALRGDMRPHTNFRAIEQNRRAAHRRLAANRDAVNLENAIFKRVSLELTTDRRAILEMQHVGIHNLSEAVS